MKIGSKIKIPSNLKIDPLNKKGQTGTLISDRLGIYTIRFADGKEGRFFASVWKKFAKGGNVDENSEMVLNQNTQIKHHTEELKSVVKAGAKVPAWVVAKVNRSANDLSDATHYLEGETKMAKGGNVKYYTKDDSYRLGRPSGSIEKDILEKITFKESVTEKDFVGNFGWKTPQGKLGDGYLFKLDDYDQNLIKDLKLKSGEKVFRYFNRLSAIGGMTPLIKMNLDKGLIYFLQDSDNDEIVFETRGTNALWIGLIEDKMQKGGNLNDKNLLKERIDEVSQDAKKMSIVQKEKTFVMDKLDEKSLNAKITWGTIEDIEYTKSIGKFDNFKIISMFENGLQVFEKGGYVNYRGTMSDDALKHILKSDFPNSNYQLEFNWLNGTEIFGQKEILSKIQKHLIGEYGIQSKMVGIGQVGLPNLSVPNQTIDKMAKGGKVAPKMNELNYSTKGWGHKNKK
jgi:hypothetical protein